MARVNLRGFSLFMVGFLTSSLILGLITPVARAVDVYPGINASFENFYAPIDYKDCPNGIVVLTRTDKSAFVEFDNFAINVSNSKQGVLGTSVNESFATEDGSKRIEIAVRICGYDTNYLGATATYTLQVKYVSADRKFAQELSTDFVLIPVDAKAKAARALRESCSSDGVGYNPYFINWNVESAPKAKIGSVFTLTGKLYRFGYPADFEKITLTNSSTSPQKEVILATSTTDSTGKFILAFKTSKKFFYGYTLSVEQRIRPVGPFFGTFSNMTMPIFIQCDSVCSYKRMNQLYALWEGLPAKSTGSCAVAKHEYSLVASKPSISISGSQDNDRNRWLLALALVKNSISDPSILTSKQTSAYLSDPSAVSSSYASSGGSVWVSGHMRNGSYVRGYSRRKG